MADIYDVIIVGSGPAGLTAALYTSRANLKTLIVGGCKWGGQLMLTSVVENYPGFPEGIDGPELMKRMRTQAERFGSTFLEEDVTAVDFSHSPFTVEVMGKPYLGKAVVLSTGAATKWLGLPSEERLIGRGVSSCASCDAPLFRGKRAIVVGGGDAAMEEALVLSKFATQVTIMHRRDAFKASKIMQDRVLSNHVIKVMWNSEVVEVLGGNQVTGVKVKNLQSGQTQDVPTDGLFVAIGHIPVSDVFSHAVEVDEKGYILTRRHEKHDKPEETGLPVTHKYHSMTNIEGVFSAGDVHDYHYRQAVTAAGYGCEAALDVERWLTEVK